MKKQTKLYSFLDENDNPFISEKDCIADQGLDETFLCYLCTYVAFDPI